jgi:gamma-glutamyl hercynylcysteine S-oxide hydrolase
VIDGWPGSVEGLAATLPAGALLGLESRTDSALLWALVLHRLRQGMPPADALAQVISVLTDMSVSGRFNLLLTDGEVIAATATGDTLYHRRRGDAVVVASEPGDDEPGWAEVPDGSLVTAVPGHVDVDVIANPDGRIAIH